MRTAKLAKQRLAGTVLLSGVIAIAPFILPSVAHAANSRVLYSFGTNYEDGFWPVFSGVVRGPDGTLYGTTEYGGDYSCGVYYAGCGTVYKVTPRGEEVILHSFTTTEGNTPFAEPALDGSGNLYATVCCNGQGGQGAIFKLASDGTFTDLHDFTGGSDGGSPNGVAVDSKGNVFGTTLEGGANRDGVLYEVTSQGQFQVLHSFSGLADGAAPTGTPMVDDKGNVYGTTKWGGGVSGCGIIYKVTPKGEEKILYYFHGPVDGCVPFAGVVRDSGDNLYATTLAYGAYNHGTLVKLSPSGSVTVLHSFGETGDDGYLSYSPVTLVESNKGNVELYGLTYSGGPFGQGTVYKYWGKGHYKTIYSFAGGSSTSGPMGSLAAGPDGEFYGASNSGGAINCSGGYNCGTVFEVRTH